MGSLRVEYDWATSLSLTGEGNGNPLRCSCLENPRDGGAWWAAVYGVAQSRTRLTWLSSSSDSVKTENIPLWQKFVLWALYCHTHLLSLCRLSLLNPWQPLTRSSLLRFLPFFRRVQNRTVPNTWRLPFLTHISKETHPGWCMHRQLAPLYWCWVFHGVDIPQFTHSLVEEQRSYFRFWVITKKTALNIPLWVSVWKSVLSWLGKMPRKRERWFEWDYLVFTDAATRTAGPLPTSTSRVWEMQCHLWVPASTRHSHYFLWQPWWQVCSDTGFNLHFPNS